MKALYVTTIAALSIMLPLALGCQKPAQPVNPTVARVTVETPDEYQRLWEATARELQKYNFRLDRRDRLEGVITSHRETTGNWFEFWRQQPVDPYYWAESNMQTIQHRVTVQIKKTDQSNTYNLDVQVDRYRYSLEERQIDNPAAAMRLYSPIAPTMSGQMAKLEESSYWIPLGRDEPMEQKLLASIIKRYGLNTVEDTQPDQVTGN